MRRKEFKSGDIVVYKGYDIQFGEQVEDWDEFTPPIFKIIKVDDLGRAWWGNDCVGIAYLRDANEYEIAWFKDITNPRKKKLDFLNNL